MSIIYFLIGISLLMAITFLAAFLWASATGQHEDLHTPPVRILFDEDKVTEKNDEDQL